VLLACGILSTKCVQTGHSRIDTLNAKVGFYVKEL